MIINEPSVTYNRKNIKGVCLNEISDAANYAREFYNDVNNNIDPTREYVVLLMLNHKGFVIKSEVVFIGGTASCIVDNKVLFYKLILNHAGSFVLIHNHPSGDPAPSTNDIRLTRQLREAATVLQINFLDHIILGEKDNDPNGLGYYSFRDAGLIWVLGL